MDGSAYVRLNVLLMYRPNREHEEALRKAAPAAQFETAADERNAADLIREAVDLLLGTGDEAAIDAAILAGYERVPAPEQDAWTLRGALAAIRAEPW